MINFDANRVSVENTGGAFVTRGRILPRGTSHVHISPDRPELGLGNDPGRNRRVIGQNRTRGHIEKEFFGNSVEEPSATKRFGEPPLSDGRLVVVGPPAGYSEMSALIVATELPELDPEELQRQQNTIVKTVSSPDLPDVTGAAFIAAKLIGLQTAVTLANPDQKPFVVEHDTPEVSTPEEYFPRSVPIPHATVGLVDRLSYVDGNDHISPHLQAEQRFIFENPGLIPLLALHTYAFIDAALRDTPFEGREFEVAPRGVEAFGTEIHFDIPPDKLTARENILFVAAVLGAEHESYASFVEQSDGIFPPAVSYDEKHYWFKSQPAARKILHIGDQGVLAAVNSPVWFSHAGGFEASGTRLLRHPNYAQLHTAEEVEVFRSMVGAQTESVIKRLQLVETSV